MTYPISFRRKVLSVREKENLTIAQVAKRFCIGVASVTRWIKTPDPKTTRNKPATKINMEMLAQDIKNYPTRISTSAPNGWGSASKALITL
ncbi:transposase [Nitrosomonas communis]|uniref:Transposase n=1 Tax=Nitrosomonas communis TaxID=44574 RepID=A0A5D3YD79_9PROT|nr:MULTISPECIES: IS630 transposase-related protein [Nitrosomonas]TYP90180.1 transposase [Nitrosomonas communis]UVS61869.1 transposase [Nitrosomonas sp. PLL12]